MNCHRFLRQCAVLEAQLCTMQSASTRPDRIPASLAGLQELNSKTLQAVQQQLQDHLTAAHKQLRAQANFPSGCPACE